MSTFTEVWIAEQKHALSDSIDELIERSRIAVEERNRKEEPTVRKS